MSRKQWNDKHGIQNEPTSDREAKWLDIGEDLGIVFWLEDFYYII